MDIEAWLSQFGLPVDADELESPDAAALVSFARRHAADVACVVEVRRSGDQELVVLEFQTGRPQSSEYAINRVERVGVRFSARGAMPFVFMLRPDFPDTEHQQLTIEGSPRAICIDDRPWGEARLAWTPAELVQRILSWFARAIRGELHDARQPIDPVLSGSPLHFLISRTMLDGADERDLIGVYDTEHKQTLRVLPIQEHKGSVDNIGPVCVIAYRVKPERMTRMQFAPNNLASLAEVLEARGIQLLDDLKTLLSGWVTDGEAAVWRLNARFVVVVEMPIMSPRGDQQDGTDLRAYVTAQSAGDLAVALGVAMRSNKRDEGSKVGYVLPIGFSCLDEDAERDISVDVAEVHYEFDRKTATQLNGRTEEDLRNAVMVGAGAIGSHVSDCLAREGRFSWTVVDDDHLLPHNLARHTGRHADVTKNKAGLITGNLNAVYDCESPISTAIGANVFSGEPERFRIDEALRGADLIIDASASVLVGRFLSDHDASARRVSIFFTPSGNGAVLLAEPEDRSLTLRDLEAQYLAIVAGDDRLSDHLQNPVESFAYTGACRAITNMIPESRVIILSGLVAAGLGGAVDQSTGLIKIWSVQEGGAVDVLTSAPKAVKAEMRGDWSITIDQSVIDQIMERRSARLPNETGGVLFGVVDIPAKQIHINLAASAPPDSEETTSGFVRGMQGIRERIEQISNRTIGQVRYVGEWHSHPPLVATMPSRTDLIQIDWLATLFDMDTLPALMVIASDRDVNVILANKTYSSVENEKAVGAV